MEPTHGFFPLDSIQFALVVWAFDGLSLILGVTGSLCNCYWNMRYLIPCQEAILRVTILLGMRYSTPSTQQCGLSVMSAITYWKFLREAMGSFLRSSYASDIFLSSWHHVRIKRTTASGRGGPWRQLLYCAVGSSSSRGLTIESSSQLYPAFMRTPLPWEHLSSQPPYSFWIDHIVRK
jgi:hypothetical protein